MKASNVIKATIGCVSIAGISYVVGALHTKKKAYDERQHETFLRTDMASLKDIFYNYDKMKELLPDSLMSKVESRVEDFRVGKEFMFGGIDKTRCDTLIANSVDGRTLYEFTYNSKTGQFDYHVKVLPGYIKRWSSYLEDCYLS